MHSSRMRTARLCIDRSARMLGGGVILSGRGPVDVTPPPPPRVGQTNACENITFARFATRVVKILRYRLNTQM